MKRWFDMKLTVVSTLAVFIWNFIFLAVNVLADYTTTPDKIMFVEERTTVTFSWTVSSSFTINEASFGNGIDKRETTLLKLKPPNITTFVSSEYQKRLVFIGDLSKRKIDFQLIDVKRSDGNKYYGCRSSISPVGGPVSFTDLWSSTQLQVLVAPKFSSSPKVPDFVKEGDSLSIPCSTSEGNPTPVVSWMKGEVNISSGWGRADLNFTSIKRKNNGSYRCVAVNMKMRIQETIQLDIKYKPNITQPKESEATEYVYTASVNELICVADGNPSPTFTWEKVDGTVTGDVTTNNTSDSASSTLALQSVSKSSDGDRYVCTASNSQGSDKATIKLKFGGTERPTTATTPGGGEPGAGGRSSDPALIGGAVGGALALILIVVIIIIIIKCRKGRRGSRGYQGRGGYKERGTKSVSDIDDYEPVTKNNELPQYATVDRSKKTPKKSDLNYAELDHQNQSERSVDARPAKRNNEPTTYAEIVQTWEPTNERTYANVPRRGLNSSEML